MAPTYCCKVGTLKKCRKNPLASSRKLKVWGNEARAMGKKFKLLMNFMPPGMATLRSLAPLTICEGTTACRYSSSSNR